MHNIKRSLIINGLGYTLSHEWLRVEDGLGIVGITDFKQKILGRMTFAELDPNSRERNAFGVVESMKGAMELYLPVRGQIIEVNKELKQHPELLNEDPYGEGWIIRMELEASEKSLSRLLSADQYKAHVYKLRYKRAL